MSPEAAFIASSAASQIVTNDHDSHSETWYDEIGIEPSEETAFVSPGALQLANNFIDQLLFNIIAVAKSTSLSSLRPAVSEVLKPKLAKDAINNADEELREYLGGGEVEGLTQATSTDTPGDWDLELVWKRTRLRCMVYSSLGDLEEEDEDYYMEQEHLRSESDDILMEVVSPAVAIFLTSILEFMGEQVLVIAGQAAFNRLRVRYEMGVKEGTRTPGEFFDRIVVEELDMERVALDRTLGRLWRAWKKKIRSPLEPNYSRPFSRSSAGPSGLSSQRAGSAATDRISPTTPRDSDLSLEVQKEQDGEFAEEKSSQKPDTKAVAPADVPLPDSDVEATYSDEEELEEKRIYPARPKSLVVFPRSAKTSIRRVRSLPSPKRPRYPSPPASSREIDPQVSKNESQDVEDSAGSLISETTADITPGSSSDYSNQTQDDENMAEQKPTRSDLIPKINTSIPVGVSGTQAQAEEDEIDDFSEEPEIMTSSRISIGGRSSPSTSESGRPAPLIHTRSNSVRSVRVIEVQSPRSPTMGSRANSMDVQDSGLVGRRISTPPIAEEDNSNVPDANGSKRNALVIQPSYDTQEANAIAVQPVRNPSPLRSVHQQSSAQLSVPTKVSILSGPTPEAHQEERSVTLLKSSRSPPMPTLPERSTSRPMYGRSNSIGVPSDRSVQRTSPESPKLSRPPPSGSPSSMSAKFKAVRTSEDSGSRRPEDRARDFENLIQSNETIVYTLTPENMRDIDVSRNFPRLSFINLNKGNSLLHPSILSILQARNSRVDPKEARTSLLNARGPPLSRGPCR